MGDDYHCGFGNVKHYAPGWGLCRSAADGYMGSMPYQPRDGFFRKARREGYRSRAAYKLLEINRRFRLIRTGYTVVGLGAAPGGWLQVASGLAGPRGRVLGFDLQTIQPLSRRNVATFELDILAEGAEERIRELLGCSVDSVLSDMAPRLSGIRDADHRRALDLTRKAFEIARTILKPRGVFLCKTFAGADVEALVDEVSNRFHEVQRVRSAATRKGSSEIYVVARGFRSVPR